MQKTRNFTKIPKTQKNVTFHKFLTFRKSQKTAENASFLEIIKFDSATDNPPHRPAKTFLNYNQIGWLKGEHTDTWPLHGNFFPRMLRGSVYRVYRYIAGRMVGEFLEALIRQDSGVQNVDPTKIFPFGSTGKSDLRIFFGTITGI